MSVLFESTIDDGPGRLVVTQVEEYSALLELFYGDELIYTEADLPLAYGARFGIDVDDMNHFQSIALREHDSYVTEVINND